MEFYFHCILLFLIPLLWLIYRRTTQKRYRFPPGPNGLPLVGNLFNISPALSHMDFAEISKLNGDVIGVNIMGSKLVVLNSADAIRQAFVSEDTRDAFAGRPDSFYVQYCDPGPSTAFMDYCDVWKQQRKFLTTTLKLFENAHHDIEVTIREQLLLAKELIRATKGEPFYIKSVIMPSLASILLILICGERFELEDPAIKSAQEFDEIDSKILAGQMIRVLTWFPFLRFLPFGYGKIYREHQRCKKNLFDYLFYARKKSFDPSKTKGFLDELFRLQGDNPWLKDDNLKGIIRETIGAGLGTTRATLLSFFLIILHKPGVMGKIQEEIDLVIGRERVPLLSDRFKMSYTEAAVMEVLRYITVAPLTVPHTTTREVQFREFFLPKNTWVFGNLWAAHHDLEVWGDPFEYRPERFLDENGKLLPPDGKMRYNWLSFSAGRRSCLGENFARSRIFLFITTLLQEFDFVSSEDHELPSHDPRGFETGITIHAPKYFLCAIPRNKK